MMSTSGGNQASIIYDGPDFCGDYIRLKDISLTTSSTATLGPYSQNEGNVTGFVLIQTQVILFQELQFLLVQQGYLFTKISRFRLLFRQLIQITIQQLSTFL